MDPIGARVFCFVLGLAIGALVGWVFGVRRRHRVDSMHAEIHPATPQPSPAPTDEATPTHPHVPGPARLIDVAAARATGFNLKHAQDLTIIEGIGPKTVDLLRAHGIEGFAQLAELAEEDLLGILDSGGSSFQFTDPAHWPRQAELAAGNHWKELKQLQDDLLKDSADPG